MYLFSLKKCLNSNSVDASYVFVKGTLDDPVWQGPEAEHEWAVGVDGNVGRHDADQVQGKAGLHHVRRGHRGSLECVQDYFNL